METILKQLDDQMDEIKERLATRHCASFDEYMFLCGRHAALREFRNWLVDYHTSMLSKLNDED